MRAAAPRAPYRKAAEVIERSDLDDTVLRPARVNNKDGIDYRATGEGEPFMTSSAVASRKRVTDLVVKLATTPGLVVHESLGVHKSP